jgi:hypothetical protein
MRFHTGWTLLARFDVADDFDHEEVIAEDLTAAVENANPTGLWLIAIGVEGATVGVFPHLAS